MTDKERAIQFYEDQVQGLTGRRTLLLTVELENREQAEALLSWMYDAKDENRYGVLKEIAWDKAVVSEKVAEKLNELKEVMEGVSNLLGEAKDGND